MGELIPLFPLSTPLFPGVVLPLQIFEPRYRRLVQDLVAVPESSDVRFFGVVAIRQGWEVERIAPAKALYEVGCTARLQVVRPEPDGGFQIVTVGGDRFRLLDVVVGEDPPYLQAEVDWLDEEEEAEDEAVDRDLLTAPPGCTESEHPGPVADEVAEEVAASVARGSMEVLVRAVRGLFARYVREVAGLEDGTETGDDEVDGIQVVGSGLDAELAALLAGVGDDPTALSYLVASVALLTTEDRQHLLAESATRRRLAAETRILRRELTLLRSVRAVPVPIARFATPMTVN
jgi:Lon protease-like protein